MNFDDLLKQVSEQIRHECRAAGQMTLGELKDKLEDLVARDYGYYIVQTSRGTAPGCPMSYRGYYDHVAFQEEPAIDPGGVMVWQFLAYVLFAIGRTFEGYKGGEYTMTPDTPAWIAPYGKTGYRILDLWVNDRAEQVTVQVVQED